MHLLILTRATNPVHFFILLSGYGLYMSYLCGKRNQSKRIFKLYVHYWLTLIAFVFIGYFIIGREVYPGSWIKIVENVTGWHTSYNGEIWFLFPYCLVAITSSLIFYLVDKVNSWTIFMATGIIYFATHVAVSMFGSSFLYSHQLAYMPILYLNFLFTFVLGALMAKYDIVSKCKIKAALCLLL